MAKKTRKKLELVPEPVKPLKYDLACGQNKQPDHTGVDIAGNDADIYFDLTTFPWTFAEDNSADEIFVSHYVEHTPDLMKFMDECWRILKPGGKMTVIAPYYNSIRCWQDPTHLRAISEATFLYFNKGWREANKLDHYPIKSDFDFSYGYGLAPEWASRSAESVGFAVKHYTNVVNDIYVTLIKR
jgi:SAM-dependent methyltransferase